MQGLERKGQRNEQQLMVITVLLHKMPLIMSRRSYQTSADVWRRVKANLGVWRSESGESSARYGREPVSRLAFGPKVHYVSHEPSSDPVTHPGRRTIGNRSNVEKTNLEERFCVHLCEEGVDPPLPFTFDSWLLFSVPVSISPGVPCYWIQLLSWHQQFDHGNWTPAAIRKA